MAKEQIKDKHADNNPDNSADSESLKRRNRPILDWKYWIEHPAGSILLSLTTTIMSTLAPEKSSTKIYLAALSLWILLGGIIFWVANGVANRAKPTQEQLDEDRDRRDEKYRDHIQKTLDSLESRTSAAEKRISGRSISLEQSDAIVKCLSEFRGQIVYIMSVQEAEARRYASDIEKTMIASGWKASIFFGSAQSQFRIDFENVKISINKSFIETHPASLAAICRIFGEQGIARNDGCVTNDPDEIWITDEVRNGAIMIRVGPQPREVIDATRSSVPH